MNASDRTDRFARRMRGVRASEIRELLKLLDQPDILSFAGGIPDPALFPLEAVQAAYGAILDDPAEAQAALQYSISEGHPPLRRWIAARMSAMGAPCGPENVLITAGSQQGLDFLARLFVSPGDTVLTARPTYLGALQAFASCEPAYAPLPSPGRAASAGSKLIYVVPDFANPSGETLTLAEREALLDLAHAHDLAIIEDGAYRELRFEGEPEPMILARDIARSGSIEQARTLYCGTLSKTVSPGLRIGWICGPRVVIEKLVLLTQSSGLHVSTINQMAAARVLAAGYDSHLERLRQAYAERAGAMHAALKRHMPPGVSWSRPQGGMFVWLKLPAEIDAAQLLVRAVAEARVAFVPGAPFFGERPEANTLRLSFSLQPPQVIAEGVARLGRLIASQAQAQTAAE